MTKLRVNFACWDYDRTAALRSGDVEPEGIDLNFIALPVQETFFRMLRHLEFDASEMSLASYVLSLEDDKDKDARPLVAIPIFLSRLFRHSAIYVNTNSNINEPKDLIGKKVGTPEWQLTATVWVRGILSDYYGVPLSSVIYYTGGEETPGRKEKIPIKSLPSDIILRDIGPNKTLSEMLDRGEIDALYTPRTPSCFSRGSKNVKRLFPNFRSAEQKYYEDTRIFPIMHTVVLRRDFYEVNRWVARSLYKAFIQSQQIAYENLIESPKSGALKIMLPWLASYVEETIQLMGRDYWAYGIEKNRHALDTFLRYCQEQGVSKEKLRPEEIFASETQQEYVI
jgi:4,5-dihydroxyphthalate decarboxylase